MKLPAALSLVLLSITSLSAQTQTPPDRTYAPTRPRTVKPVPSPEPTSAAPVVAPPVSAPGLKAPVTNNANLNVQPSSVAPITIAPTSSIVPLPLAHPLTMSKIRANITDAQRLMTSRVQPTALVTPPIYFVTITALDPEKSQIHTLTLLKQTFLTRGAEVALTTSLGKAVRVRILRANGVNTALAVFDETGRSFVPLIVEYPIERGGIYKEMAYYISAHPVLMSPDVVNAGKDYVRTMIDLAANRLRNKGALIDPRIQDVAERLCIVEHTDHDRFFKENNRALFEEIFSLYALNELNTYRYSVSTAGAGGMVQMIPATYQMIRQRHPGIGLNPDFVAGMRNHGNALEAMLLYMQDTWNDLIANPDIADALSQKIATPAELLSAGYNSNPARLPLYIRRGGSMWRTLIPAETQIYLQIYRSLDSLVPMKQRANQFSFAAKETDKVDNIFAGSKKN